MNGTAGTNPTGNVLTNDTDVDSSANGETKAVSGVAAGVVGSATSNVGSTVTGSYGSINIAADGSYTYTVDNTNATVQALRTSGQTVNDIFTYSVQDTAGLTSTTQITIAIQGANDAPFELATATRIGSNLISNGGFESNVSGWTLTGGAGVYTNAGRPSEGSKFLAFSGAGAANNGVLSQTVTTVVGTSYELSFDFQNSGPSAINQSLIAQILNGATVIASRDFVDTTQSGGWHASTYQTGIVRFIATSTSTIIRLMDTSSSTANDMDIDRVQLFEVSPSSGSFVISENSSNGTAVGTTTAVDVDSGDTFTYALSNNASGRFAIDPNTGLITVANSGGLDFETADSHIVTVVATDAGGLTRTQSIVINLTAVNETPTAVADTATAVEAGGVANGTAGNNPTGNVLTNDTDVDAGDSKTVSGVAAGVTGSVSTNVGIAVTGDYGSIILLADGSYEYTVDNSNAAVQALRLSSQTLSDVFTYTMSDAGGLTSTTQITVTIQGSNDNPVANVDTATAVEAGGVNNSGIGFQPVGNVLANDTDVDSTTNGETKTVTGVAAGAQSSATGNVGSVVTGDYGAIILLADGSYEYTVDDSNAAVQALRINGQTLDDVFTYTVTDAGGLTSTTQITITVRGRNDNPVGVNDTATAVEAGGVNNSGIGFQPVGNVLANDTDVDSNANGETKTVSGVAAGAQSSVTGNVGSTVTGNYGSIILLADGSYEYTVDDSNAAVQALRLSSQTLADVFTYEVVDAGGLTSLATITVTIQGANDNPVANVDTATAVEAGGVNNSGIGFQPVGNVLANDTDVDSTTNGETKTVTGVAAGAQSSATGMLGRL